MTDIDRPKFRILDNVQSTLPDDAMWCMLSDVPYVKWPTSKAGWRKPGPGVKVATYHASSPEWIHDKTLAEFILTFSVMEEWPHPKPDWFLLDEQGRELRRASNAIAYDCRRGPGRSIYHGDDFKPNFDVHDEPSFNAYDGSLSLSLFTKIAVDWVPVGYVLVLYEATPVDVPFIYRPGFGILPNKNYRKYGRLVRITG